MTHEMKHTSAYDAESTPSDTLGLKRGVWGIAKKFNGHCSIRPEGSSLLNCGIYLYGGIYKNPRLGYTLPKDAQIADTMTFQGTLVYQGTYTTDVYGRRITPIEPPEQRSHFLLFFGCSVTFGLWVHDDETMPFYAAQYAPHYRPYNYGVSGYGPNQMLAQLQNRDLTQEMPEPQGIAIYTFIDDHIYRALGGMQVSPPWGVHPPLYILDSQDRLVPQERATVGRRLGSLLFWGLGHSQILTYFHIMPPPMPRIKAEHMRLTARVIEEARKAFHQQFPRGKFHIPSHLVVECVAAH